MANHILRVDASARSADSVSRQLTGRITDRFADASITTRDLSDPLPQVDEAWVVANNKTPDDRNAAERAALALSDALVAEVQAADVIVIGAPLYNFSVPAALKAWIDQIARAGVTFRYTENGPEGLLSGKRVIVAVATGGTPIGSPADHATPYLRFVMGFLGLTDVEFVAATGLNMDADRAMSEADAGIEAIAA